MPFELPYPLQFHGIISTIGPMDILDIFIVAVILYKVYVMLQDTRAITLVKGILVLLGVTMVCSWRSWDPRRRGRYGWTSSRARWRTGACLAAAVGR